MSESAQHSGIGSLRAYEHEPFSARQVSRLVEKHLHEPDQHVANFRGDLEAMLADGEFFGLDARDLRFLAHALQVCIRHSQASPEGVEVSLSNRQWGAFVGIRRKFLSHRRNPANLINFLRARRTSADIWGVEDVPSNPLNPTIENETNP